MLANGEKCERAVATTTATAAPVGVHGHRVLPASTGGPTACAWTETEESGSPTEHRRLLSPDASPSTPMRYVKTSRIHAGLTLGVRLPHKKTAHHSQMTVPVLEKLIPKTKAQRRREKIIEALRPPYFILTMIVINTGVHVWGSEALREKLEWSPGAWAREPWRLVTYGWVHASASHVALNALVGLAVGWRLEREQGWWRAAALWAGGVAAGALGAGALQPRVRVVGASAAVYALLTAHLPNVCLRFGHVPLWWFRPLSVVVLAASEVSWTLLRPPPADDDPHDHVAWAAHVFGAVIGVPLAFLVFTGENAGKRHVSWCRAISLALMGGGGAAAGLYYAHCARAARA